MALLRVEHARRLLLTRDKGPVAPYGAINLCMSYQLERGEIPSAGVRRIAREQLQKSLEEISKLQTAKAAKSVHSARSSG